MRTRFSARSNLIFFETFARTSRRKSRIERMEASRLPNENTSHFRIPPMIYSRLLTASVGAAFITSCAAAFVAPYDETTDRLLTDLSVKTETAIARADSAKLSEDDRAKSYDEALGTVRTEARHEVPWLPACAPPFSRSNRSRLPRNAVPFLAPVLKKVVKPKRYDRD